MANAFWQLPAPHQIDHYSGDGWDGGESSQPLLPGRLGPSQGGGLGSLSKGERGVLRG